MPTAVPHAPIDLSHIGHDLQRSLRVLLEAIPGTPHRPSSLSEQVGVSRVTVSKLLGALQRTSPYEFLEAIPGPESLRLVVLAAENLRVERSAVENASAAIERFSMLIRERFGTRTALNAAIGARSDSLRARTELLGRTEAFKGMRQVLGVEAETWLTSMLFAPSREDPEAIEVANIQGALGLRRLRADREIYFSVGPPYRDPASEPTLAPSPVTFDDLYTHEPAKIETSRVNGQIRHRLIDERLGKHAVADMLAVGHNARGSRRYATEDSRRRGVSLFVDVPVRLLVCDALIHESLFPGSEAELLIFNTAARGPANPNDPTRDLDRVPVMEAPKLVHDGPPRFEVPEVPNYGRMIERLCGHLHRDPAKFRVYRVRIAYPVYGFQYVMAFEAPLQPGPEAAAG
ncbi:MAG: hypothetical protein AB7G11_16030 [Phycisphaerales bacterium]